MKNVYEHTIRITGKCEPGGILNKFPLTKNIRMKIIKFT